MSIKDTASALAKANSEHRSFVKSQLIGMVAKTITSETEHHIDALYQCELLYFCTDVDEIKLTIELLLEQLTLEDTATRLQSELDPVRERLNTLYKAAVRRRNAP